jgi:hypothetical protein
MEALILVAFGLVIFAIGFYIKVTMGNSPNWPTTKGLINISKIEKNTNSDRTSYRHKFNYTFNIEGKEHTGHLLSYKSKDMLDLNVHQELLNEYPEGKKVIVYYNPNKPKFSIIEPGVGIVPQILISVGVVFSLIGLAIFFSTGGPEEFISTYNKLLN